MWTFSDCCADVGEVEPGRRAGRVQATGGAVWRGDRGRLDDGGQAEAAVLVRGHQRRRVLRQANRAGRHDGVRGRSDDGRAQGRPVGGHRGAGRVRAEAGLENVSTVLRRGAGRLPQRVRPGPRSATPFPTLFAPGSGKLGPKSTVSSDPGKKW